MRLVKLALLALLVVLAARCSRTVDVEDSQVPVEDTTGGEDGAVDDDVSVDEDAATDKDKAAPDDAEPGKDTTQSTGLKVADLQQKKEGLECPADSTFINLDTGLKLDGVVVTAPVFAASQKLDGFFVQDVGGGEYSGIKVVLDKGTAPVLKVGDVVNLVGDLKEYYCLTEFDATNIVVTGKTETPTAAAVQPADVAADAATSEKYEGVLVKLEGVPVAEVDQYGNIVLEGGAVVNDAITDLPKVAAGCKYESLVGVIDYSFKQYLVLPRSLEDLVLDESVPCEEQPPATGSIKEMQESDTSTVCTDQNFLNAGAVELKGVVVMSPKYVVSKDKLRGYWVFDGVGGPWSGLLVTVPWEDTTGFQVGDIVDVTGEWMEYYCLTEVKGTALTGTGKTFDKEIPVSDVTAADLAKDKAEQWEGVLVRIKNVEVTEAPNNYGEFKVTGDVMVQKKFDLTYEAKVGDKFAAIVGVVTYDYGNFKILPRSDSDFVQ
ncbi:MAG: hypothetical protein FJ109_17125 [Deltaproteobacteria bacterium]|nr:hypothetical protein [Deltaproteobacteria bacterium]